jgi:hypothetical protein
MIKTRITPGSQVALCFQIAEKNLIFELPYWAERLRVGLIAVRNARDTNAGRVLRRASGKVAATRADS